MKQKQKKLHGRIQAQLEFRPIWNLDSGPPGNTANHSCPIGRRRDHQDTTLPNEKSKGEMEKRDWWSDKECSPLKQEKNSCDTTSREKHYYQTDKKLLNYQNFLPSTIGNTTEDLVKSTCTPISEHANKSFIPRSEELQDVPSKLTERRIVDVEYFTQQILNHQEAHSNICSGGRLEYSYTKPVSELTSSIFLQCTICNEIIQISSEDDVNNAVITDMNHRSDVTEETYGFNYTQMKALFEALNVPIISRDNFAHYENIFNNNIWDNLYDVLQLALQEEVEWAVRENQVEDDGTPWITVYIDGGWNLQEQVSNKVVVIIGQHTQKILYLGVSRIYCTYCNFCLERGSMPDHNCFMNGHSSVTAEDVLVDVIANSKEMCGVYFKKFFGPSGAACERAYEEILQRVYQKYCLTPQKQESACDFIRSNISMLYELGGSKEVRRSGGSPALRQLGSQISMCLKLILRYHGEQYMSSNKSTRLSETLINDMDIIPDHVFGQHSNCKSYFCTSTSENNILIPKLNVTIVCSYVHGFIATMAKRSLYLLDFNTSTFTDLYRALLLTFNCATRKHQEKNTKNTNNIFKCVPDNHSQLALEHVISDPSHHLEMKASKCKSTDKDELNLDSENSPQFPPDELSAIGIEQSAMSPHTLVLKNVKMKVTRRKLQVPNKDRQETARSTAMDCDEAHLDTEHHRSPELKQRNSSEELLMENNNPLIPEQLLNRITDLYRSEDKRETEPTDSNMESSSQTHNYTQFPCNEQSGMAEHTPVLKNVMMKVIKRKLQVTSEDRRRILLLKKHDISIQKWVGNMKYRLNATYFGHICKRTHLSVDPTFLKKITSHKEILRDRNNLRQKNEKIALQHLCKTKHKTYRNCGLFIDAKYIFLCGCPTALINQDAICVVKCFSLPPNTSFKDMVQKPHFLIQKHQDGSLRLSKFSNLYFEIQGILNISKKTKCYFTIYNGINLPQFYQTIYRDQTFWKSIMVPKLLKFYNQVLLPELADPNLRKT